MNEIERLEEALQEIDRVHALLNEATCVPGGAGAREDGLSLFNRVKLLIKEYEKLRSKESSGADR